MQENIKIISETVFDKLGNCLMKVRYEEGGAVSEKVLPLDKYLALLGDATFMKSSDMFQIGRLPKGYFDAKVSSSDPSTFDAVLVFKAQKRAMKFANKHWVVPFPALAFKFKVQAGVVTDGYCFGMASDVPDEDSILYRYPFGNVSDIGRICYGNIRLDKMTSIMDVTAAVDEFFTGETNNDYFAGKNVVPYTQAEMLEKLKKLDEFPLEWLRQETQALGDLLK